MDQVTAFILVFQYIFDLVILYILGYASVQKKRQSALDEIQRELVQEALEKVSALNRRVIQLEQHK